LGLLAAPGGLPLAAGVLRCCHPILRGPGRPRASTVSSPASSLVNPAGSVGIARPAERGLEPAGAPGGAPRASTRDGACLACRPGAIGAPGGSGGSLPRASTASAVPGQGGDQARCGRAAVE